jgi:hypothetical protein
VRDVEYNWVELLGVIRCHQEYLESYNPSV